MIGWLLMAAALAVDLDEARQASTARAIGVLRQQAALDRARGVALGTLADTLPQVGLFAQATAASGPNPFGRFTSRQVQAGVSGSWRLVDPAGWGASAAARSSVRGEQALLDWARAMARRDATVAFADAIAAVETTEALRTAEADAQRAAEGIQSLVDAGLRPTADVVQAEAAAAALTAERKAAEGEIGATCAALQAQMGTAIDGHCDITPPGTWPSPVALDTTHPALLAAEEALTAARRTRSASVLANAPVVVGTAQAAQNQGTAVVGDDTENARSLAGLSLSAGLRADMTVMGSGSGVAQIRQATAERRAAEVALDEQLRLLAADRVAAEARHTAARASVEATTVSLGAASEALALVESRYEQGLEGLTTFLDARRVRDRALVARASARAEEGRALAELEASRGVR